MFKEAERRILTALAAAMLPMREEPFSKLDVPALVEEFMMGAPAALKLSTRLAMWSVELAPPAWGFGLARFSSMDRATAEQYLLRWDRSPRYPIRSLFFALKVIVMGMAYDTPEIARDYCGGRV